MVQVRRDVLALQRLPRLAAAPLSAPRLGPLPILDPKRVSARGTSTAFDRERGADTRSAGERAPGTGRQYWRRCGPGQQTLGEACAAMQRHLSVARTRMSRNVFRP